MGIFVLLRLASSYKSCEERQLGGAILLMLYLVPILWYFSFMTTTPEQSDQDFPYMHAAAEAAKTVRPGNELQEAALAEITALAFKAEVARAFPETKSE